MTQVVVYRNLNRGGWSVALLKGRVGVGRVIDHVASITLANVRFHVQPAAQRKVQAGAARTVHAWAIGDLIAYPPEVTRRYFDGERVELHYNPRRCGDFTIDGEPVTAAALVEFAADGRAYLVSV